MGKVRFGQPSLGYRGRTFDYCRKTLVAISLTSSTAAIEFKGFFTQEFVVYERDFFYWTPHTIPAVSADILTNSWVEKLKSAAGAKLENG